MDIPETIKLKETMHGHGAKGMAVYEYEDTAGLGIRMEAKRSDSRSPFKETWFIDALPNREFATFKELRDTALPLTDMEIEAATSSLYPLIKTMEPDSCGNRCRLCPRPALVPGQERIKYETWRVTIAYSWKNLHSLSLCNEHLEKYQDDPKGLSAAIDEELAQRKSRANKLV